MQIPIKRAIDRVPGGMMVVPLLIGALFATFAPETPKFFGSFTGALFTGSLTILAVFYVCMGATIDIRTTPYILKKGGTLLIVKIGVAAILGIIFGHILGEKPITGGLFAGLSTLAIVAAMNDTNGGLYMALMGQYGDERDVGAYSLMTLESGPFLTMVTLGVAGVAASSAAGNAAAVPAIVASANPAYAPAAAHATILVAAAVIVTTVLVPLLKAGVAARVRPGPGAAKASQP